MSKAEDRAFERCPQSKNVIEEMRNARRRASFIEGYHQAEKDLELTWKDIKIILDIENDILRECNSHKELVIETYPKGEDYYGEILKRFKEGRKINPKDIPNSHYLTNNENNT